jgi:hypothetical protein
MFLIEVQEAIIYVLDDGALEKLQQRKAAGRAYSPWRQCQCPPRDLEPIRVKIDDHESTITYRFVPFSNDQSRSTQQEVK